MSFVHLHNHTIYSLLDGYSKVKDLVARAKELGMPALAITDHGNLHGAVEFYRACKAAQIKPIIGMETYLARRGMGDRDPKLDSKPFHLLLLAENYTGYENLLRTATASQLDGFYYRPRIDHPFLADHTAGLICTTGCLAGEIAGYLEHENNEAEAIKQLDHYFELFGRDHFFFELQHHDIPELHSYNKKLIEIAKRYDARFIATNDAHYTLPEDAVAHDVMLCIQTNSKLADKDRMRFSGDSFYLRSVAEMKKLWGHIPGALSNTLEIAERCAVSLDKQGYHLPHFSVPDGFTEGSYLRHLCEIGLEQRYGSDKNRADIVERLDYELGVIDDMGFSAYFLIVWDLCSFARQKGIWYNARGSAAGSLVAYSLFITLVDPLHHRLIFERFLNPDRVSMPDIDLDFQDDRRNELLDYCVQKYGADNVAQIITFGTLKARAALRDVGRVMNMPLPEVDRITKLVPNVPGKNVTIDEALETLPDFKQQYDNNPIAHQMIDLARKLEGVVRNVGTHAAGVVITPNPVSEYVPLHRPTSNTESNMIPQVTQFPMEVLDSLGLLKVDFLGLRTLTIMARACALIQERHGIPLDIDTIPTDAPAIFELLGQGDVDGVFQVEGAGMRRYLVEMKPTRLEHVIAMVALYRPGPLEFIPSFIKRMHGLEPINYRHPAEEEILAETYGITVYQEQIMYTAMKLANFTAAEADVLRKSVAKKNEAGLLDQRNRFVEGAVNNNIDRKVAESIFANWEAFARYGFPKGHAADYAVITCQTAYLKAHYPTEYMTALLSAESSNSEKVAQYVLDTERRHIKVLPPSINFSTWDFNIQDYPNQPAAIRFGLGAIKNVGEGPVTEIVTARQAGGPFADLNDFCTRVDLRKVGKRALEFLIKASALDELGDRWQLFHSLESILAASTKHHRAEDVGQYNIFDLLGTPDETFSMVNLVEDAPPLDIREMKRWEKELVGLYVTGHPLIEKWESLNLHAYVTLSNQLSEHSGQIVQVAGLLTNLRTHYTNKGKTMAFSDLEDPVGVIPLVIFPRTWEEIQATISEEQLVLVTGKAEEGGKILVERIETTFNRFEVAQPSAAPSETVSDAAQSVPAQREVAQPVTAQPVAAPEKPAEMPAPVTATPAPTIVPAPEREAAVGPASNGQHAPFSIDDIPEMGDHLWDEDGQLIEQPSTAHSAPVELDEEGEVILDLPPTIPDETNTPNLLPEAPPDDDFVDFTGPQPIAGAAPPYQPGSALPEPAERLATEEKQTHLHPPSGRSPLGRPGLITDPVSRQPKKIILTLRPTDTMFSYQLRLKWAYNIFTSFPGQDRFTIVVMENGRAVELDFANDTTGYCEDMVVQLSSIAPVDDIEIQPILLDAT